MPKRTDIEKILIIGSGPIIISQACEFDYSGTQACKVLKEEGYKVILINSNPATIMTDPMLVDRTYIEPITPEIVEKIIKEEKPDVLLPTLGGQTALNVTITLAKRDIFNKYNVEVIGANINAIHKAEDRKLFKEAMERIGIHVPYSDKAYNINEAVKVVKKIGFPAVIRPSFTLGGTGGAIAYNMEEFKDKAQEGLEASIISEILIEESIIGWKEFELEVMRDIKDNVVIICSIENFDPMGIHTGDSITIAPIQTLTDKEYQKMRNLAIKCIREIGVETGGANIQFAVNPQNGKMLIIEMNPRVSRSSALASKATGFPIAKIAAKLAIGYTLDEIPNDITKKTPACFEPTIDYCVVKIPRFAFEKFPTAEKNLGVSMKSVGEVMAIGRTFKEALQKGLRSLEIGLFGLENLKKNISHEELLKNLRLPTPSRIHYIKYAFQKGLTVDEIYNFSKIDRWFLYNIKEIADLEKEIKLKNKQNNLLSSELLLKLKQYGFADKQIGKLLNIDELFLRNYRERKKICPVFKTVDTCAGEFESYTPYYYSTYENTNESSPSQNKKVIILGSGPNRIGQGIEFDYCCCHASYVLKEEGIESIMINCNPETVSTDYDTSTKLYFEPLTLEDVLNIVSLEKPIGIIVQFGGQTPLNIASTLAKLKINILGTSSESIDKAENRKKFKNLLKKLKIPQPENGTATSFIQAKRIAEKIGYPIIVRPSYVLGGRAMEIVYDEKELVEYMEKAIKASPEYPVLIDKFLEDAIEVDVDTLSDGKNCFIAGIMEHIEEAGIHSGDSAMVLPPYTLGEKIIKKIKENTCLLAYELKIKGLLNIQYAIKNDIVYVLEVNPRASRTVPFVSKVIGLPLAKLATKIMLGKTLQEMKLNQEIKIPYTGVKESVFPFVKFPEVDVILGPEMKSTGEVMGIDKNFGLAYAKSQIAAGQNLPLKGNVFISVREQDKRKIVFLAKKLVDLGFKIFATSGTAYVLRQNDLETIEIPKLHEGIRPNIIDRIKNKEISLIINTPAGKATKIDESKIRRYAILYNIPLVTTIAGAQATVNGIESLIKKEIEVKPLQAYYKTEE